MSPSKASPDDFLAPRNHRELNATFYAATPSDYFNRRLQNVILVAGKRDALDRLLAEGVSFKSLKVGGEGPAQGTVANAAASADHDAGSTRAGEHFVIAEAEVLAHHVGETLLRLYLAHEFADGAIPPPCPWLEVSRLRIPSEFKARVAARFGPDSDPQDAASLRAVARVFHLTDRPETMTEAGFPEEQWIKSLRNIEGYLRGFARQFLDRAALYNAAKHGLALLPSEMSIRLGDGALISAEGPTIRYLEIRERDGRPRWTLVNHWVKSDRQLAFIYQACQLIERIWDTARIRYLPDRPKRFEVHLFTGPTWEDLRFSKEDKGVVIEDMIMDLLYSLPDDNDEAGQETQP